MLVTLDTGPRAHSGGVNQIFSPLRNDGACEKAADGNSIYTHARIAASLFAKDAVMSASDRQSMRVLSGLLRFIYYVMVSNIL